MTTTLLLSGIMIAIVIFGGIRFLLRRSRRRFLLNQPLPPEWEDFLENRYHLYSRLPTGIRKKLAGLIQVFIDEKRFEACGDLQSITDEIRVVVAAQACLLLVGIEKHGFFPRLRSILIYPGAYRDHRRRTFSLGNDDDEYDFENGDDDIRLGESWDSGSVVLSWESVLAGASGDDDGMNVAYHEFAHQLDQIDGRADGAPTLPHGGDYAEWFRVFTREYETLVEAADDPRADTLLDPYGATDPAEFFAVATETFFEIPGDLKSVHPELFHQLVGFFGIDPTGWVS